MPADDHDDLRHLIDPVLGRPAHAGDDDDDDDDDEDEPEPPKKNGDDEKKEGGDPFLKKLLKRRTIFIYEAVSAKLAKQVATLLTLMEDEDAEKPINVYINSPGGSADSGFAIYDWLRFVKPPVRTIVAGMCASAGITIFLGGDEGMRMSMPNSRFMLHQPSTQTYGQASDIEVTAKEILKIKARYNVMVAQATGKPLKEVERDVDRDFWLGADEAKAYGLVQKIVSSIEQLES